VSSRRTPTYCCSSRASSVRRLGVLLAAAGTLLVAVASSAEAKSYKGAEVYSRKAFLFGRVEVRMRMIRGSGLLSTFFTYKTGSELAGAFWEETDIEVFGKDNARTWQSNIIVGNPKTNSEAVHTAPASLADDYHTYTLEWTPNSVIWLLDGTQVRKAEGGPASSLTSSQNLRFNAWSSESTDWVGDLDESALPAYQFVNWIKYYRYENGQFVLDWTDDFDTFDTNRWARGSWTFDGNRVDFAAANAVVQDGVLILAISKDRATGFSGTVPNDPAGAAGDGSMPEAPRDAAAGGNPTNSVASGCGFLGAGSGSRCCSGMPAALLGLACVLGRRRRRAFPA
jgi:endo-1,3-1,4-beta-glycanase ExoK